eukprot:3142599-Prymnesium_polylepis.1
MPPIAVCPPLAPVPSTAHTTPAMPPACHSSLPSSPVCSSTPPHQWAAANPQLRSLPALPLP